MSRGADQTFFHCGCTRSSSSMVVVILPVVLCRLSTLGADDLHRRECSFVAGKCLHERRSNSGHKVSPKYVDGYRIDPLCVERRMSTLQYSCWSRMRLGFLPTKQRGCCCGTVPRYVLRLILAVAAPNRLGKTCSFYGIHVPKVGTAGIQHSMMVTDCQCLNFPQRISLPFRGVVEINCWTHMGFPHAHALT